MNRNVSFIRKVSYLSAIAVLLIPLSYLCQPATFERSQNPDREDAIDEVKARGKLAQLRVKYDLSQANLGDIDPASETMKLATLGFSGLAANLLSTKAMEYKKKEAYDKASAAYNQITKFAPHFTSVWEFQGHNLAFNISVEFDNYKHRYDWIKRGIKFVTKGTLYNRKAPKLVAYAGFIIGNKIGKSDEHLFYREMYRDKGEQDFRDGLARFFPKTLDLERQAAIAIPNQDPIPDNWQMARLWYEKAIAIVKQGALLQGQGHSVFFSKAPLARKDSAIAWEEEQPPWEDQNLPSVAQRLWKEAGDHWRRFGNRDLLTSYGTHIRFRDLDEVKQELEQAMAELDAVAEGARERLTQKRREGLKKDQPVLYDALVAGENSKNLFVDLTPDKINEYHSAKDLVRVRDDEVASAAPEQHKARANRLLGNIMYIAEQVRLTELQRRTINYDYWIRRCDAESQIDAILARQYLYEAKRDYDQGDWTRRQVPVLDSNGNQKMTDDGKPVFVEVDGALEKYEKAWEKWGDLFSDPEFAKLLEEIDGQDLVPDIAKYRKLLRDSKTRATEKELPTNFPLMSLLDFRSGQDGLPTSSEIISKHTSEARNSLRKAKDLSKTDKDGARKAYDEAWTEWARLFDADGGLMIHTATDDLESAIEDYRSLLKDLGESELPADFPLAPYLNVRKAFQLSLKVIIQAGNNDAEASDALVAAKTGWEKVLEQYPRLKNDRRVMNHVRSLR